MKLRSRGWNGRTDERSDVFYGVRIRIVLIALLLWAVVGMSLSPSETKSKDFGSTFAGPVSVKKWSGDDFKEEDLIPLNSDGETLAADAERAFLLRINGQAQDLFDAAYLRSLRTPLYVIAEKKFQLPQGPPLFKFVKDQAELDKIANEAQGETFYISLKALGMPKNPELPAGVVVEYKCYVKRPRQSAASGPEDTANSEEAPGKSSWLFGATYRVLVVREGQGLVFFEGEMVMS